MVSKLNYELNLSNCFFTLLSFILFFLNLFKRTLKRFLHINPGEVNGGESVLKTFGLYFPISTEWF